MLLALLRAFTISLLLLLLFDPVLPSAARPAGGNSEVVIVDASLSMELPAEGGKTRWQDALERARRASGRTIVLMGGVPRRIPSDSLALIKPGSPESRLLPALQAASEGGAAKAIVITDGAIEDLQEVERWLPRLGLQLEIQTVGAVPPPDRALSEVTAPAWVEAGKPIEIQVGASVSQPDGTPLRIIARADNLELGQATLAPPAEGRVSTGSISLTPTAPPGGGLVRIDLALDGQDAVPANDRRSVYVLVGAKPAGIALISFAPDWEPRFLQPVLEQAIGLPVRTYLRAGPAGFVTGGVGGDIGKRATDEEAITAARTADVLVIHGAGASLPQWARDALTTRPRVLILPRETGFELPNIDLGQVTPGDWYVSADIPSSPVASLLAGLPIENLPPLAGLHLPRSLPDGAWTPLQATRGRRGAPAPPA
ncbi:MAG: VWA domain-containing protein, partial [Gemmatimonadota bacterium]